MIDEENLIQSANELLAEIQKDGLPENALLTNQRIQDLIKAENIYTLILTVKWFDSSATVPTENSLLRDRLIKAANDLNKLTPGVEDYDFIERDVQHFTDMIGKKYTLSVVIRLYDDRTTDLSGTNF
jgi:hypothetical protein